MERTKTCPPSFTASPSQFLKKEMQISNDDLEEMQFERVHRIPTHPITGKSTNKKEQARPIIAKVSFFKDKELIKFAEGKKIWCS